MVDPKEQKKTDTKAPAKPKAPLSFKGLFSVSQNVIGVDIGSGYLKLLQLQKSGKSYFIVHSLTRAFSQAAKENPVEKKKFIQQHLKTFVSELKLKTNLARIAVSGKGIFIFSLVVPLLNKKDLRGLIGLELKKRLPFQLDINNISFDYIITGQTQDEKGQNSYQVTCIAADRLVIDEQIQTLKEINIRPVAINANSDALGNLVAHCVIVAPEKTIALLEIGANTSLLNFYKGKNLVFTREIPIGGEHFNQAMAKSIKSSVGTVEIGVEDAEKLKRNWGIPLEDEARTEFLTDFGGILGEQISTLLRPPLERLILEITRTVSYYTKTFKTENIEELYLSGGSSRLRNLDKFLLYNLERHNKVERLNVLSIVKGWAEANVLKQELGIEQAAPHLAVAFGLCLDTGGKINLLPVKEKLEQRTVFLSFILKVFFPVVVAMFLVYYGFRGANILKYKKLISRVEAEIARLEPIVSQVNTYLNLKTRLDERKDFLEGVKKKQPLWWGVFKELSVITPKEVVLQEITVVPSDGKKKVFIKGKIFAKYTNVNLALSQFVMVIEESPFFSQAEILANDKDMFSQIPAANFEVSCQLVY